MPWLSNWFYKVTHPSFDVEEMQQKMQAGSASTDELLAYVDDLEYRISKMIDDLKQVYKQYDIAFRGFKSLDLACAYLRQSLKAGTEEAYNNLIKLESLVTAEEQRHLTLIKMAVAPNGVRVFEQIRQNPENKAIFDSIFGYKDASAKKVDGLYQKLWSEIHALSEYVLLQKNRVYH